MAYASVTLSNLRQRLQDKWEGVPFWSEEEALTAINESLHVWNMLTAMWKVRATVLTTPNDPWVPLPSTMTYGLRVEFGGHPLGLSSIQALDLAIPRWQGQTTASGGSVPTSPRVFAKAGINLLAIWPADAVGLNSLVVDSVTETPVLQTNDDTVDVGEEDLNTLLGYALHVASFKEAGPRWQSTQGYYRAFMTAAADRNHRLRTSAYFRVAMGLDQAPMQPFRVRESLDGKHQTQAS